MRRSRSLVPTQSLCLTIRVAVYPHELRLSEFVETDFVWRRGMWGWDDFSKMREHVTRRTGNTDSRYVARESLSLRWQVYIHFSPQWDLPATSLWPCTLLSSGLYRYVIPTSVARFKVWTTLFFFFHRLFLLQPSSAVQFIAQPHKQLSWCNRRVVTR